MPSNNNQGSILGINIGPSTLSNLATIAEQRIRSLEKKPFIFVCANPHSIVVAQKDQQFFQALNNADATVADGSGVSLMSKVLNINVGPRITGGDYFKSVMELLNERNGRVFFFGSSEKVLGKIKERLSIEYPNVILAGTLSPPYGNWSEAENEIMLKQINESNTDVLWVGMTAPKQEKWIEANKSRINASVVGAVGAVFDFFAGTYPRAPQWASSLGIEWLFRLIKEPKRMWRRNFISTPKFLYLCLVNHVIMRKHKPK